MKLFLLPAVHSSWPSVSDSGFVVVKHTVLGGNRVNLSCKIPHAHKTIFAKCKSDARKPTASQTSVSEQANFGRRATNLLLPFF